ncbi:hypothetical protein J6590_093116 [Homalodisca vitripennis]|nr:hypothetical protein J6590_093116 [Homalodisca vitripennis]
MTSSSCRSVSCRLGLDQDHGPRNRSRFGPRPTVFVVTFVGQPGEGFLLNVGGSKESCQQPQPVQRRLQAMLFSNFRNSGYLSVAAYRSKTSEPISNTGTNTYPVLMIHCITLQRVGISRAGRPNRLGALRPRGVESVLRLRRGSNAALFISVQIAKCFNSSCL